MFYNGTTSGAIYVKQTGSGNTGWVLKWKNYALF
jgi:hypothetical protein